MRASHRDEANRSVIGDAREKTRVEWLARWIQREALTRNQFRSIEERIKMGKFAMELHALASVAITLLLMAISLQVISAQTRQESLNQKSIVFDLKTPKVFYCPQDKAATMDKMIVKAQPLEKLCEFNGKPRPKHHPSDCYNDVDESEFACDEKKRFTIRLDLAGEVDASEGIDDLEYIVSKSSKKKATEGGKKY